MGRQADTLPSHVSLSQLRQINEQFNRFEAAWKSAQQPRIEEYLAGCPSLPVVLQQLILIDVEYRRRRRDEPQAEEAQDEPKAEAAAEDAGDEPAADDSKA